MKLKEYREYLNKLVKDNPEYDELDCVYSGDDEGNSFQHITYHPTPGIFSSTGYMGEFESIPPIQRESIKPNAICIN